MNDNDHCEAVPGVSALPARPANAARVGVTQVVRRCAPSNSRSSGTARAARLRPYEVVASLQ